jgi:hypothetical protein
VVSETILKQATALTVYRLVIIATLSMYIATGVRIYQKGAGMRFFMGDSQHTTGLRESTVIEDPVINPFAIGKSIVVTTQIQYDVHQHEHDPRLRSSETDEVSLSSYSSTKNLSKTSPREEVEHSSSDDLRVSRISRDAIRPARERNSAHLQAESGYKATAFATKQLDAFGMLPARPATSAHHQDGQQRRAMLNDAALAYLKVAFLMFIALFVVWVRSTMHRYVQATY